VGVLGGIEGVMSKAFERPAYFNQRQPGGTAFPLPVQVLNEYGKRAARANGGHQDYLADMTAQAFWRAAGVDVRPRTARRQSDRVAPMRSWANCHIGRCCRMENWPGAPAVAIWDAQGQLFYVAP